MGSVVGWLVDWCSVFCRHGGGIGEGSIRKTAYFQSSIDPTFVGPKVRNIIFHMLYHVMLCVFIYLPVQGRDKTRVVTYRCPGNTAVQVSILTKAHLGVYCALWRFTITNKKQLELCLDRTWWFLVLMRHSMFWNLVVSFNWYLY